MDTTQYLDVFIDESTEHVEVLYKKLLDIERNPQDRSIIDEIFRAAHTLKGMAATMGYRDIANLTHKLENIFDGIRQDKITVNSNMVDVLMETVDILNTMLEDIANGGGGAKDVSVIANRLQLIETGHESPKAPNDLIRVSLTGNVQIFKTLDEFERSILEESSDRDFINFEITVQLRKDCLLKGARVFMVFEVLKNLGEVIKTEPSINDLEEENFDSTFHLLFVSKSSQSEIQETIKKVSEIESVNIQPFLMESFQKLTLENDSEKESTNNDATGAIVNQNHNGVNSSTNKTIRVNIERLDSLMNLFEELVIDRSRLDQIAEEINHQGLQETVERMSRVSGDLQNIILTMRMVPIDQVFNRFPRMVRSLAKEPHKEIDLEIIGADTELDRTVIDEIAYPLVHLIRNAIDHGIETPDVRQGKGKSAQGTIKLEAYHSGNHVFIEIVDDGAGINTEKVLNKAVKNGVVNESDIESLSKSQIYELIMESGFSTADTVSDISGRGVGLDVVRNNIESLGGSISINSSIDQGSRFSIQLPLTLSIISVLLVQLKEEKYAIPLSSIIETTVLHKERLLSAHNKRVIDFRGKVVPLLYLQDLFDVPNKSKVESDYISIVIVKKGDKMTGLVVDALIGQQEVVLKSLGNFLPNTDAISGATILGDGEVALIIDSNALII